VDEEGVRKRVIETVAANTIKMCNNWVYAYVYIIIFN